MPAHAPCPLPSPIKKDNALSIYSLLTHVTLVADEYLIHTLRGILLRIPNPIAHIIEGPLIGHIIDEEDAHGTPIVGIGDGAEALLSRRIPNLQLDALALQFHGANLEVNANGGDETGCEGVVAEAQQ